MVNEFIKELLVPLVLLIAGTSFSGAAAVAWWGIRRMISGQDKICDTLAEIRDTLSDTIARVGQLETLVEHRDKLDDQRHKENVQNIRDMWSVMRGKKT